MARFCNKCGYPIEPGGIFCTECGSNDIRDEMAGEKKPVKTTPAPKPTKPPTTQPAPANVGVQGTEKEEKKEETTTPEAPVETVLLPQVGTIQTETPEETKNSFADVPDYMNGDATKPVVKIDIQKDVLHQNTAKKPQSSVNLAELPSLPTATAPGAAPAQANAATAARRKKKKTPAIYVFLGIGGCLLLAVLLMFFYYYGKSVGELGPGGPFKNGILNGSGQSANTFDYTTIFNSENSFRVGNESYGYISIPNTWVNFKDVNGNNTLQYTDNGTWIITIYAMDTTTMTAANWANSVYKAIEDNGGQDIRAGTGTIDTYNALKITAYYPKQKKYLATWFFESKNGKTHYLAIEGPENSGDPYNSIYSFKEDQ